MLPARPSRVYGLQLEVTRHPQSMDMPFLSRFRKGFKPGPEGRLLPLPPGLRRALCALSPGLRRGCSREMVWDNH